LFSGLPPTDLSELRKVGNRQNCTKKKKKDSSIKKKTIVNIFLGHPNCVYIVVVKIKKLLYPTIYKYINILANMITILRVGFRVTIVNALSKP